MNIRSDVSLRSCNTLGIDSRARYFTRVESDEALLEALEFARARELAVMPLGEGSNIVLSDDFPGLVIQLGLSGYTVEPAAEGEVKVSVRAGECWHEFVRKMIAEELYGLENLSLIPGCVGAAPIQNIGAYGVEIKDCFHSLRAVEIATGHSVTFDLDACQFGYRDSVFKQALRDQFIITDVTFILSRHFEPVLSYAGLGALSTQAGFSATLLSDHICALRQAKLPDPKVLGNAGSFFKNPIVSSDHYEKLRQDYPELVAYPAGDGFKLAAGWLIDRCGGKAMSHNGAAVHQDQALVLVNQGGATGSDILALATDIRAVVEKTFGVILEIEPRVY